MSRARSVLGLLVAAGTGLLSACTLLKPPDSAHEATVFKPATKSDRVEFLNADALRELEANVDPIYRLGAGDQVNLQVVGRPDISGRHVLGPDGVITVPVAGPVSLEALTRTEAGDEVRKALDRYYEQPFVQIGVESYTSFRVTVLGRVQVPGQLAFDKQPRLLDPLRGVQGRDRIIWVDLKRLLNGGDTAYNIALLRGDVIYIPDSSDTMVYVLGAVHRPGAYRLTPDMSLLDALSQAGGPNEDGNLEEIRIHRPSRQLSERVSLKDLQSGQRRVNFGMEEGDVIFVPKTGIANFGYVTRNLGAGLSFLTVGAALSK
jgi:polysaccharide biosynthesis/export protein